VGNARGTDRLANFNDAVAAIAITLLILPLVDAASAIGDQPVQEFLSGQTDQFFAFGLSFAVIAMYWRVQHALLEGLIGHSNPLVFSMLLWMLAIVFLPFPTELLSVTKHSDPWVYGLYVGTMLVASVAIVLERFAISRAPELYEVDGFELPNPRRGVISILLLATALIIVVVFPSTGLWSLLLLFLDGPIQRLSERRPASS
jgi:uncharacterized membrane protein